jgi:signal transduction histidine kinase
MRMKFWPVGGLSWRLAVSYFLVTLVAALTIELAFGLRPAVQQLTSPANDRTLEQMLLAYQAPIASYLQSSDAPDQFDIQSQFLNPMLGDMQRRTTGSYGAVALLDQRRAIVASAIASFPPRLSAGQASVSQASASGTLPSVQALLADSSAQLMIQNALQRPGDTKNVSLAGTNGVTTMAVPERLDNGQLYGVLVALFNGHEVSPASQLVVADSLRGWLRQLGPAALYFVLLATLLGTLTGVLVSRNLRRRLRHITLAADAWSRGEFQVEVRDPSRDELGQLTRDLNSMAEQLQGLLASQQELAAVAERNRLARDLHDSVKQHVFAATLQIAATRDLLRRDPDTAAEQLEVGMRLANDAQQELTSLIHELRPPALAGKGLMLALREYCAAWSHRMGIEVEVHAHGERPVPLGVEQALFRITQEALANVARHSGASQATVSIAWESTELTLTVSDDGRGFDATSASGKGVGLQSMRERATLLHGSFAVETNPAGRGARVLVRIPLETSAAVD